MPANFLLVTSLGTKRALLIGGLSKGNRKGRPSCRDGRSEGLFGNLNKRGAGPIKPTVVGEGGT